MVFWVGLIVSLSSVVGKSLPGGLFQPVLAGFADGGSASFVLVERGGCSRCPGCRRWLLYSTRTESSLGPEHGGVGDGQQVGPLGLERPAPGLDPGLVGGSRRAPEVLRDGDHGHEPAGAGGDHLSPVVRDGQQQRSQIIIAIQDQLALKGVSALAGRR